MFVDRMCVVNIISEVRHVRFMSHSSDWNNAKLSWLLFVFIVFMGSVPNIAMSKDNSVGATTECEPFDRFLHVFGEGVTIKSILERAPVGEEGSIERQYSMRDYGEINGKNFDDFKNPLLQLVYGYRSIEDQNYGTALALLDLSEHYLAESQICNKDLLSVLVTMGRYQTHVSMGLKDQYLKNFIARVEGSGGRQYQILVRQYDRAKCILTTKIDEHAGAFDVPNINGC